MKQPWNDETTHLKSPDTLECPWCRGDRELIEGQMYAVVQVNGDRPLTFFFDSPHVAWSYYDTVKMSWTSTILVEVLDHDSVTIQMPQPI